MITTMRELRQLIADNCDPSQPLRVVANDVGKKANKHSPVRADEGHPAKFSVSSGLYDDRGVIEISYDEDAEVLMPEAAIDALDALLEDDPRALIGWVYFFYFPFDATFLFGRTRRITDSLMDTSKVQDIYFAEDEPNTLVFKAEFNLGEFNV